MIFIIEDGEVMAECMCRAVGYKNKVKVFSNAIDVMNEITNNNLPDLIFLDILLIGPDGFTFLNEAVSYSDTAMIPVVIVSSLDFGGKDFLEYGVVGVLNKEKMVPGDIEKYVNKYC